MTYSYFFGLLVNFSITWQQWVFVLFILLLILIGFSSIICLNCKNIKSKIAYSLFYFLVNLICFGLLGSVLTIVLHFITYSLISEFRKDY